MDIDKTQKKVNLDVTDWLQFYTDPETYDSIMKLERAILLQGLMDEARNLRDNLVNFFKEYPGFAEVKPDYYKNYNAVIARCNWIIIPALSEAEILELFGKHLIVAINDPDIDIWYSLKNGLLQLIIIENRDELIKKIKSVLLQSQQILTAQKLEISKGKIEEGTVANWLKDYNVNLGTNSVDAVKRREYLMNSKNTKKLDNKDREKLTKLFNLYEKLKLSTGTLEGVLETIPLDDAGQIKGVIRDGRIEEYKESQTREIKRELSEFSKMIDNNLPEGILSNSISSHLIDGQAADKQQSAVSNKQSSPEADQPMAEKPNYELKELSPPPVAIYQPKEKLKSQIGIQEEAKKLRGKIIPVPKMNIEKVIEDMVQKFSLSFKNENMSKRFKSLAGLRLRGIGNKLQVQQNLMKPVQNGGLELSLDKAEKVAKIIEKVAQDYLSFIVKKKSKSAEIKSETSAQQELNKIITGTSDFSLSGLKAKDMVESNPTRQSPRTTEGHDKEKVLPKLSANQDVFAKKDPIKSTGLPEKVSPSIKAKTVQQVRRSAPVSSRPQMQDVKYTPKVTGPVEELADLSLENFRKLGGSPVEIIKKIVEKIDILTEESYLKRDQGIKAWRRSEVAKLYLSVGQESMEKGISVEEAIKTVGKGLSLEEFDAIADLNEKLRN